MDRWQIWAAVVVWVTLVVGLEETAYAQSGKIEVTAPTVDPRAQAFYDEARLLLDQGNYSAACSKFEESLRVQRGMSTLFRLSGCHEKLGRTATAWRGYREVEAASEAAGQPERMMLARERAIALEPKLSKLRIDVKAVSRAATGLIVRLDGVVLDQEEWGLDRPVDPGNHKVSASSSGKALWSVDVELREPGKLLVVTIPPLSSMAATRTEARYPDNGGGPNKIVVIIGFSLTAVAAGSGVAFAIASQGKANERDEFDRGAPKDNPQQFKALEDQRLIFARGSFLSFVGAGITGSATAFYAIFTKPSSPKSISESSLQIGLAGYGLSVAGRW
jgi:hypothetical protein